mmetsp:Transcript_38314/g.28219  ORF Transcript_38314/g.28219 Transcript_38314/m.28219 type:complete len:93 (+) Transcript_38314:271-549(+)
MSLCLDQKVQVSFIGSSDSKIQICPQLLPILLGFAKQTSFLYLFSFFPALQVSFLAESFSTHHYAAVKLVACQDPFSLVFQIVNQMVLPIHH